MEDVRIPVNVDAEGRLLCPCHAEPMVKARDQSQARPGETIWNCAEYAEAIEPYILRQLAEHWEGS